jgi:hypothetical protein
MIDMNSGALLAKFVYLWTFDAMSWNLSIPINKCHSQPSAKLLVSSTANTKIEPPRCTRSYSPRVLSQHPVAHPPHLPSRLVRRHSSGTTSPALNAKRY